MAVAGAFVSQKNIVGKGDLALHGRFHLFPQYFIKSPPADSLKKKKKGLTGKGLNN